MIRKGGYSNSAMADAILTSFRLITLILFNFREGAGGHLLDSLRLRLSIITKRTNTCFGIIQNNL